jgi:hypothetical protein
MLQSTPAPTLRNLQSSLPQSSIAFTRYIGDHAEVIAGEPPHCADAGIPIYNVSVVEEP